MSISLHTVEKRLLWQSVGNWKCDSRYSHKCFCSSFRFLPKVVISDFYSPTAFSSINISKLVSIRMLEHVYITGHQGILASKIQIFSFINFSGSSCTKDGIWYVHQPCICTHRRCHLDPAKQKKKLRENDCQPQNRVLTLGPQRSCLVTQQISVRQ